MSIIKSQDYYVLGRKSTSRDKNKIVVIIPAGNLLVEILLAGKLLATNLIGKVLSLDFIVGIKPRGKRTQH